MTRLVGTPPRGSAVQRGDARETALDRSDADCSCRSRRAEVLRVEGATVATNLATARYLDLEAPAELAEKASKFARAASYTASAAASGDVVETPRSRRSSSGRGTALIALLRSRHCRSIDSATAAPSERWTPVAGAPQPHRRHATASIYRLAYARCRCVTRQGDTVSG